MQKILICLILWLGLCPKLGAQESTLIPPPPKMFAPIFDYARILSDEEYEDLDTQLRTYESQTSNEFVVVTWDSLDNAVLEQISLEFAQSWQIGKYERNNGILLFIAKKERQARLEIGKGLTSQISDEQARQILQKYFKPNFAQKKYVQGIKQVFEEVSKLVGDKFSNQPKENTLYRWQAVILLLTTIIIIIISQNQVWLWLAILAMMVTTIEYTYYQNRLDINLIYAIIYWLLTGSTILYHIICWGKGGKPPKRGGYRDTHDYEYRDYNSGSSDSSGGSFDGDGGSGDW